MKAVCCIICVFHSPPDKYICHLHPLHKDSPSILCSGVIKQIPFPSNGSKVVLAPWYLFNIRQSEFNIMNILIGWAPYNLRPIFDRSSTELLNKLHLPSSFTSPWERRGPEKLATRDRNYQELTVNHLVLSKAFPSAFLTIQSSHVLWTLVAL